MTQLQEILATADYKIVSGSEFLWHCFGENSRFIECETDLGWLSVVVDIKTGVVYEVNVEKRDYSNPRYIWYNPEYRDAYFAEFKERGIIDHSESDGLVELLVWSDLIEKATGIMQGIDFDERVVVEFNCPADVFLELAKLAHKMNITLNELFEYSLKTYVNNFDK